MAINLKQAAFRYWDTVGLFSTVVIDGDKKRIPMLNFLADILLADRTHTATHSHKILDDEELLGIKRPQIIKKFLKEREWKGFFFGLPSTFYLAEILLKFPAAAIIESYVYCRDQITKPFFKKAKNNWLYYIPSLLSILLTGILFFANALIAQTLFFLGNVVSHARHFVDGLSNFLTGEFEKGLAVMAKGFINLLGDAIVGGICYVLSFIFPHLAPGLVPATNTLQSSFVQGAIHFFTHPQNITMNFSFPSLNQIGFSVIQFVQTFFANTKTNVMARHESLSINNQHQSNLPGMYTYRKLRDQLNCGAADAELQVESHYFNREPSRMSISEQSGKSLFSSVVSEPSQGMDEHIKSPFNY